MQITHFKSILDLINAFPDEESCIHHLEVLRWNGNVVSPFDSESRVYVCAGNKYRCANTKKYFNVKTGTLFENTKVPLQKWFLAIYLATGHKKGISSLQLSRDIDVTQKSAWFMLQRIRNCFDVGSQVLEDQVEIDETYIGGKNKNRHEDKKVKGNQGRSAKDKTPVLGMLERDGKLVAKTVEDVQGPTLAPEIKEVVKKHATIYTDEWRAYKSVQHIYDHRFVKHNHGEYVKGNVHTNTIEGFWSILKRGIVGIYHFTSKKHLQKYVDEFVFRYNHRLMNESQRFNEFLKNTEKRLRYEDLIYGQAIQVG